MTNQSDDSIRSREDVCRCYNVDPRGVVRSPGTFEGEMVYVPYFWDKVLEGWQDWEEDDGIAGFVVSPEDRAMFPELKAKTRIRLVQTNDGFVTELGPEPGSD